MGRVPGLAVNIWSGECSDQGSEQGGAGAGPAYLEAVSGFTNPVAGAGPVYPETFKRG